MSTARRAVRRIFRAAPPPTVPYRAGGSVCHAGASSVASVGAVDFSLPDLSRHVPASVYSRVGVPGSSAPRPDVGHPTTMSVHRAHATWKTSSNRPDRRWVLDSQSSSGSAFRGASGKATAYTAPPIWMEAGLARPQCPDEVMRATRRPPVSPPPCLVKQSQFTKLTPKPRTMNFEESNKIFDRIIRE